MDDFGAYSEKDCHIDAYEEPSPLFIDNLTALQSLINLKTGNPISKDLLQKELNLDTTNLVAIEHWSQKELKDFAQKYFLRTG